MNDSVILRKSSGKPFIEYVLKRMKNDSAFGAALRRADNAATESQSWEYFSDWCDLDKEWELRPFSTIAAAAARAKPVHDGATGIGKAIASCYVEGNRSDQAKAKFRRLLACDSIVEVCAILRPLLNLISSRSKLSLCYGQLLDDLLYFGNGEKTKVKWAVDFYGRRGNDSLDAEIEPV